MYPPWIQEAFALPKVTQGKAEDEHHLILLLDVIQKNQESWDCVKHLEDSKVIVHFRKACSLSTIGIYEGKNVLI